jgi:hypothetical protein
LQSLIDETILFSHFLSWLLGRLAWRRRGHVVV